MAALSTPNSTNVRFNTTLTMLRLGFRLGGLFRPSATTERASDLFCTPFPGSRRRALQAPTGGAVETALDIEGQRIQAYAWGDPGAQPYVLFSHGWSSHGTRFLPWVEPLRAAGHAVVAFDQPAHGRSAGRRTHLPGFVRTLSGVARHFGPAAAVVGHSLGGAAAAVALAEGLDAERAVLVAPAADPAAAIARFAATLGLSQRICARMLAGFESRLGVTFSSLQAQHSTPRIARPALIVHDFGDREVPWEEGERYARFWRGSRLLCTTGLGHNRIALDPAVISAAVRFLGGEAVGERVVSTPALPYGLA